MARLRSQRNSGGGAEKARVKHVCQSAWPCRARLLCLAEPAHALCHKTLEIQCSFSRWRFECWSVNRALQQDSRKRLVAELNSPTMAWQQHGRYRLLGRNVTFSSQVLLYREK